MTDRTAVPAFARLVRADPSPAAGFVSLGMSLLCLVLDGIFVSGAIHQPDSLTVGLSALFALPPAVFAYAAAGHLWVKTEIVLDAEGLHIRYLPALRAAQTIPLDQVWWFSATSYLGSTESDVAGSGKTYHGVAAVRQAPEESLEILALGTEGAEDARQIAHALDSALKEAYRGRARPSGGLAAWDTAEDALAAIRVARAAGEWDAVKAACEHILHANCEGDASIVARINLRLYHGGDMSIIDSFCGRDPARRVGRNLAAELRREGLGHLAVRVEQWCAAD